VYDAQRAHFRDHRRYTTDLAVLGLEAAGWNPPAGFALEATADRFSASASGTAPGSIWRIREDGRLWMSR
jgi:hypothetical protein